MQEVFPTTCPTCSCPIPASREECPRCGGHTVDQIRRMHAALRVAAVAVVGALVAALGAVWRNRRR